MHGWVETSMGHSSSESTQCHRRQAAVLQSKKLSAAWITGFSARLNSVAVSQTIFHKRFAPKVLGTIGTKRGRAKTSRAAVAQMCLALESFCK
eukprot:4614508-Amphidinium_carterae.1